MASKLNSFLNAFGAFSWIISCVLPASLALIRDTYDADLDFSYSADYPSAADEYSADLRTFTTDDWHRIRKVLFRLAPEKTSLEPLYDIANGNFARLDDTLERFLNGAERDFIDELSRDAGLDADVFRDPLLPVTSEFSDDDVNVDPEDIPRVEERNQTQGWEGCLRDYDMVMLPETLDYERTLALIVNNERPFRPRVPVPEVPPANPVARQIVDSNARRPAGLFQGAFHWVGAAELCFTIGVRYTWNGTGETRLFKGKYVRLSLPTLPRINVTNVFKLSIGLCAPDTCTNDDIARYVGVENRAMIRSIVRGGIMPRNVTYVYSGQQTHFPTDTNAVIVVSIIGVLAGIVVISSIYDGCFRKTIIKNRILKKSQGKGSRITSSEIKDAEDFLYSSPSFFDRLETAFSGFSAYSNIARFYRMRLPEDHIACLNGIRGLTYLWMVKAASFLYGVYVFQSWTTQNGLVALRHYLEQWTTMPLIAVYYTNAPFFYVSGFVCVRMFIKSFKANGEKITTWFCLRYILRRFWTLFPTHAVATIIYAWTYRYLVDGPLMSPDITDAENCKEQWWLSLLMVNNIFGLDQQCMPWTYYYCCLWQLGAVSIVVLVPLVLLPLAGYIMTGLMYIAHIIAFAILETQCYDGKRRWYFTVLQTPWCHAGPYVIGMAFAMLIQRVDRRKKWHWFPITMLWVCSVSAILLVIYGPWDHLKSQDRAWTREGEIIFDVLAPQMMALAMGWVTFACWKGYGGVVGKLLEWGVFTWMGNMMLALSLFMGPAMLRMFAYMWQIFYVHENHMGYVYYGHLINIYVFAHLGALVFVFPLSNGVIAGTRARTRLQTFLWARHPTILDTLGGTPAADRDNDGASDTDGVNRGSTGENFYEKSSTSDVTSKPHIYYVISGSGSSAHWKSEEASQADETRF